jgi:RND family efflux transporter MFP subunit
MLSSFFAARQVQNASILFSLYARLERASGRASALALSSQILARYPCPCTRAMRDGAVGTKRKEALSASRRALAWAPVLAALALSGAAATQTRPLYRVKAVPATASAYTVIYPLTGAIAARVQSDIAFRTSGRIASRRVEIGDHVKADDIVAELDPKDQQTAVDNAQAALDSAKAQLRQAQATFDRQQSLMTSGFATRAGFDQAQEAQQAAQAAVAAAQAALGTAREQLSFTVLKAGLNGIIVGRSAEVGQVALPGQTIFTIAEDGPRDAVFDVQESLIAHPPKTSRADIALLSDRSIKTTGVVREVSPTVDPASETVRVKVALETNPPQMTLGASVVGSVPIEFLRAFVLPASVLYEWGGKPAVWIVDPRGKKVSIKPVTVEAYVTDAVVLSAGIEPGDLVVTAGSQSLRLGEEVEVIGAAP